MRKGPPTDYETYAAIMGELLRPITAEGLDSDTLKRLYESKLVYLENLRAKCFWEMNRTAASPFSVEDYSLILKAVQQTRGHLRDAILLAINSNLAKRQAV